MSAFERTLKELLVSYQYVSDTVLHALKVHRTPNTAAMQYSVEIAELLVKHGCSPAVHDNSGLTPVMYAVQQVAFHSEYFVCFVHTCFFVSQWICYGVAELFFHS